MQNLIRCEYENAKLIMHDDQFSQAVILITFACTGNANNTRISASASESKFLHTWLLTHYTDEYASDNASSNLVHIAGQEHHQKLNTSYICSGVYPPDRVPRTVVFLHM